MLLGSFCQQVVLMGCSRQRRSLAGVVMEVVPLPLIDAMKMAAPRGSSFSSRRLASRTGNFWRRVRPLEIFCGDLRRAKSLRWTGGGWGFGPENLGSGARGRFWGSDSCLGMCLGGVCGGGRRRAESGGGDLLGVVGLSFDAQNSSMDILELLGERLLNNE